MTTAASLAERVTTALMASSTVIDSLGLSPSLVGACADACAETCRRESRLSFFFSSCSNSRYSVMIFVSDAGCRGPSGLVSGTTWPELSSTRISAQGAVWGRAVGWIGVGGALGVAVFGLRGLGMAVLRLRRLDLAVFGLRLGLAVFGPRGLDLAHLGLRGLNMTLFGLHRLGMMLFGLRGLDLALFGLRGLPRFGRNMAQRERQNRRRETDRSETIEAEHPTSSRR